MSKATSILEAAVAGLAGGAAGVAVMNLVMKRASKLMPDEIERDLPESASTSWSLVGERHQPDEAATTAVGRIGFETVAGKPPTPVAKERLGQAVHWGYGIGMGAVYGLLRGRHRQPMVDAAGGALYGLALWVFGDMLMVPLLGLADKPTKFKLPLHAQTLAGHLAYGVATAAGTQAVSRLLPAND